MNKLNLLAVLFLLIVSCQQDDQVLVPICEIPGNLAVTNIEVNSATLNWSTPIDTSNFEIEYGPIGFSLGTGNTLTTNVPSITLHNLLPNTSYDFYVQKICSSSNVSVFSEVDSFTTLAPSVIPEFRQNLSSLNLFQGSLSDLIPSPYAIEYDLNTRLFNDYAQKQRVISLPAGTTMTSNGDGLPTFPNNTVIAKTFFYNADDRNESLGRTIIETRILIKINNVWESGDYMWNDAQTEAILNLEGSSVPVSWVDENGVSNSFNYQIPSNTDCFTCHQKNNNLTPIGPKLRSLNFEINGMNQLQRLKDMELLIGLSSANDINVLPNWQDTSSTLEQRARAYFDIQCAHCHSAGGFCEVQSTLRLNYETSLSESKIIQRKNSISGRINTYNQGFSMPLIGTSMIHSEGADLIQAYLNSL